MLHADGDSAAHDLRELLGEARGHLRIMGVDHLASIIALNTGSRAGDEIGGLEDDVAVLWRELVGILGIDIVDQRSHGFRQFLTHGRFGAGVTDGVQAAADAAGSGAWPDQHPRSPITAMTPCAWSHAVVQAPITTTRPCHSIVCPPSIPTLRTHLPSWISRNAARMAARVLRSLQLSIEVKSLIAK